MKDINSAKRDSSNELMIEIYMLIIPAAGRVNQNNGFVQIEKYCLLAITRTK